MNFIKAKGEKRKIIVIQSDNAGQAACFCYITTNFRDYPCVLNSNIEVAFAHCFLQVTLIKGSVHQKNHAHCDGKKSGCLSVALRMMVLAS